MQSDGLNSTLSPVVYGDIVASIKINTQIHKIHKLNSESDLDHYLDTKNIKDPDFPI